jgi:hypothetical protein
MYRQQGKNLFNIYTVLFHYLVNCDKISQCRLDNPLYKYRIYSVLVPDIDRSIYEYIR